MTTRDAAIARIRWERESRRGRPTGKPCQSPACSAAATWGRFIGVCKTPWGDIPIYSYYCEAHGKERG